MTRPPSDIRPSARLVMKKGAMMLTVNNRRKTRGSGGLDVSARLGDPGIVD